MTEKREPDFGSQHAHQLDDDELRKRYITPWAQKAAAEYLMLPRAPEGYAWQNLNLEWVLVRIDDAGFENLGGSE